jgi:hypothetical protein
MRDDQLHVPPSIERRDLGALPGTGPGKGMNGSSWRPGSPAITNTLSPVVGPVKRPANR